MALHFIDIGNKESIIEVYGTIGERWDSEQANTTQALSQELARIKALKADTITVKINSLGGDVNHALAIFDLLEEHTAQITTQIIGLCASAATVIAAAGTTRKMSRNALFLIHQCHSYVGRANETQLAAEIESQRTVNKRILSIYTEKCANGKSQEIENLFVANNGQGKWIEASEALRLGFVTDIYNESRKAACIDKKSFENSCLPELPEGYTDFLTKETESQPETISREKAFQGFIETIKKLFPNQNNNQNQPFMKNLFPLICLATSMTEGTYNKEKGATFTDEQLQAIEKRLKEFSDLKIAFEAAKTAKETAENSLAALQKQYDDLKAIIDKLPGSVPNVDGDDAQDGNADTFADWQKKSKYYQEIQQEL